MRVIALSDWNLVRFILLGYPGRGNLLQRYRAVSMSKHLTTACVVLLLLIGLSSTVSAQHQYDGHSSNTIAAVSDSAGTARASAEVRKSSPDDLIIGPDDVLAINVWKEPEVSQTVPVRPDGKISLPLIGEVMASGLTPIQLQASITDALDNYLSHPAVTVIVHEVKSQKYVVVGQVAKPGSYELQTPMTVLDAIAAAGGPLEYAKLKSIYVLRPGAKGTAVRLPFNYKEAMKGKHLAQNVELRSRDTVVVP